MKLSFFFVWKWLKSKVFETLKTNLKTILKVSSKKKKGIRIGIKVSSWNQ